MIISKFQRNRENGKFRQNSHKREPNSPNPWRRKDRNNLKDESINWVNTKRATKLQPPLRNKVGDDIVTKETYLIL